MAAPRESCRRRGHTSPSVRDPLQSSPDDCRSVQESRFKPSISHCVAKIALGLGLSPAPAPIAMAPGGATGFCDVISRRTGRRAWRYHYIINASMNIDLERPTLPGILDSDRFGRRQAVLGGLRKSRNPATRFVRLAIQFRRGHRDWQPAISTANLVARCNQIQQLQSIQQMKATEEEVS
jgi:hypothetical protein